MPDTRPRSSVAPWYDTYGGTLSLLGEANVVDATLVLDGGWRGNQRVDLDSATVTGRSSSRLPGEHPHRGDDQHYRLRSHV